MISELSEIRFHRYNIDNFYTRRIMDYYTNPDLGGGPLTNVLKSP